MMYDIDAVDPSPYGTRSNIVVSHAKYAEASKRTAANRSWAEVPQITTLLTAHGHSLEEAKEIVRVAQQSWSKNSN